MTAQEIRALFKEKRMYGEVLEHANGAISVDISWGDWKHDHSYCDFLMRECGYICTDEQVTEEDGSDCYSAIHFYEPIK